MIMNPYDAFVQAQTEQELLDIQSIITQGGYSSFRLLLDTLTEKLKIYEDDEIGFMEALLASVIPDSPSFKRSIYMLISALSWGKTNIYACKKFKLLLWM